MNNPLISNKVAWVLGLVASLAFASVVLWHYHDLFWFPLDEGIYTHIADRMLHGEALFSDIQDIHPGYIHFINEFAFYLFGESVLSLRYPLVAAGLVMAGLSYLMLAPLGIWLGFAGSAAVTCLSITQFFNPTQHWYALASAMTVTWLLANVSPQARWRLEAVGFFIGITVLMRQLTGVWTGMGALCWLLYEAPQEEERPEAPILARMFLLAMAGVLLWYATGKTGISAWFLYLPGPGMLLCWLFFHVKSGTRAVLSITGRLAAGGGVAALPLLYYLTAHDALSYWWHDNAVAALSFSNLPFVRNDSYVKWPLHEGIKSILNHPTLSVHTLSALFLIAVTLLAAALSITLCRCLKHGKADASVLHPLPIMGTFYFLAALSWQSWAYLFWCLAPVLLGLLWHWRATNQFSYPLVVLSMLAFGATGLYLHTDNALARVEIILAGTAPEAEACPQLPRLGIRIGALDCAFYRRMLDDIEAHAAKGDAILALPVNPELYFLSGRRNPMRFFDTALGITTEAESRAALDTLRNHPPTLVFYNVHDAKFYKPPRALIDWVHASYDRIDKAHYYQTNGDMEVYRLKAAATGGTSSPVH